MEDEIKELRSENLKLKERVRELEKWADLHVKDGLEYGNEIEDFMDSMEERIIKLEEQLSKV